MTNNSPQQKLIIKKIHEKFRELEYLLLVAKFEAIYEVLCGLESVFREEERKI